jgi:hypothetical protein
LAARSHASSEAGIKSYTKAKSDGQIKRIPFDPRYVPCDRITRSTVMLALAASGQWSAMTKAPAWDRRRKIGFLRTCIRSILGSSHVMERTMTRKAFGLAGIAAALLAAPALAHHAFAIFDQSKMLYMSGTVKQFELVNPHAWLHLAIANEGDASTWSFEGGSVSQRRNA